MDNDRLNPEEDDDYIKPQMSYVSKTNFVLIVFLSNVFKIEIMSLLYFSAAGQEVLT